MYILLLVIPSLLVIFCSEKMFLTVDSVFLSFGKTQLFSYFPLVNFNSNSFSSWQFEPLSYLLTSHFGFKYYFAFILLQFSISLSFLIRKLEAEIKRESLVKYFYIIVFNLQLIFFFGLDTAIIGTIAWIPLLLLSIINYEEDRSIIKFLFVVLLSLLFAISANYYAAVTALILILLCMLLEKVDLKRFFLCGLSPLLIVSIISLFFVQYPIFPDYEFNAHLVPGYGVLDGLQPLVGNMPKAAIIDRDFIRNAYGFSALLTIAAIALVFLLQYFKKILIFSKSQKIFLYTAAVLLLFVLLDSSYVEAGDAQIMPLQSISRIIPGLFFIPLSPLVLVLGLLFFTIVAATVEGIYLSNIIFYLTFLLSGITAFQSNQVLPLFSKNNFMQPWLELRKVNEPERAKFENLLNSPSYYLVREKGINVILDSRQKNLNYQAACNFSVQFNASNNSDALKNVCDGRDSTRWSSKLAKQTGEEWINLYFKEKKEIKAIRLTTGKYFTDFARGIAIEISSDCQPEQSDFKNYKRVVTDKKTEGEIKFTEEGEPFYSTQYTYSAYIPDLGPINCLLIRQIGKDDNFEWSVADIQLAE